MNIICKSFREGFVGSFVLAGAILMAIISVASAFANGGLESLRTRTDKTTSA